MNDERFLKDWLRDTTDDTQDPQASADRVLAHVPEIRQRSRWWPWLPGRRRTRPRPTDDDHPPTVSGRTRLMLGPVKAIAAGALALALSAAFLITQPTDRPGVIPGAEEGANPAPPVEVIAKYQGVSCEDDDPVSEVDGPIDRSYGWKCEVRNEWSDPRLQGTESYVANHVTYEEGDEVVVEIANKVHDIVTDGGVWRMRPQIRFEFSGGMGPGAPDWDASPEWWVLDGEGVHEGLSALLIKDGVDLRGFIVSTDMLPPAPEGASTE